MLGISYSVMGILAIIIHCTINRDVLFGRNKDNVGTDRMREYRMFLLGILAYYISDSLWGILDELGWVNILKLDTFVYYIAMSVAVVFWCDYVVAYIHQENLFGKILRYFGRVFVVFGIGALILNIHKKFFFWFDSEGVYHAGPIRYIVLYIQIVLFLLATFQALYVTIRTKGVRRRRHMAICTFGIVMVAAIIAQIFYPMLPIYSMGYLVGMCFLHIYVEEDEKDEYIENIKKQMDITSSMAGIFFCSYYIDMTNRTFIEIDNKIAENVSFIGKSGDATDTLEKMCEHLVLPQYKKEMQEFTNLDTLDSRIKGKNIMYLCNLKVYIWAGQKDILLQAIEMKTVGLSMQYGLFAQ